MDDEKDQEPAYFKYLPRQNGPYYLVIELYNRESDKVRLVSLKSKDETQIFVSLFNLISCFRNYEAEIAEDGDKVDDGPEYIPNWVRTYMDHRGVLEFTEEILNLKNVKYLMYFAENNSAVRGLVFGEDLMFTATAKKSSRDDQNHKLAKIIDTVFSKIQVGNNVTELRFHSN